jgi:hypothetical protein
MHWPGGVENQAAHDCPRTPGLGVVAGASDASPYDLVLEGENVANLRADSDRASNDGPPTGQASGAVAARACLILGLLSVSPMLLFTLRLGGWSVNRLGAALVWTTLTGLLFGLPTLIAGVVALRRARARSNRRAAVIGVAFGSASLACFKEWSPPGSSSSGLSATISSECPRTPGRWDAGRTPPRTRGTVDVSHRSRASDQGPQPKMLTVSDHGIRLRITSGGQAGKLARCTSIQSWSGRP